MSCRRKTHNLLFVQATQTYSVFEPTSSAKISTLGKLSTNENNGNASGASSFLK